MHYEILQHLYHSDMVALRHLLESKPFVDMLQQMSADLFLARRKLFPNVNLVGKNQDIDL